MPKAVAFVLLFTVSALVGLFYTFLIVDIPRRLPYEEVNVVHAPTANGTISRNKSEWPSIFDCPLPQVDPWEPKDLKYFGSPKKAAKCNPLKSFHSNLTKGKLWIDTQGSELHCRYRCLNYKTETYGMPGSWTPYEAPGPATVTCDWVDVVCKDGKNPQYRKVHSQIYAPEPSKQTTKRYNVYILGLDAISQGQFHRTMPKTAYFLENEMDGINFKHLSKVGYNSVPNQMAALFGQRFTTVRHAPQGYPTFNMSNPYFCKRKHSKDEQYIGFIYNEQGYRTAHIDDMLPLVTNYPNCAGFGFHFTNHSAVPFVHQTRNEDPLKEVLENQCKLKMDYSADFFAKFIKAKTSEPKFAFTILVTPGHGRLSDPYQYDDYFYRWLQSIKQDLDDSFLLVWSDHGLHYGGFYSTDNGQTDTRNPMLTVVLPKDLRGNPSHQVIQNLRKNAQTLVSQYDIFPTLVDLATADFDSPASFNKHLTLEDFKKLNHRIQEVHGDSLLRPLTHRKPTCAGLGIPFTFCLCRWPLFTPHDSRQLRNTVYKEMPLLLNDYIKSIGATDKCRKIAINKTVGIDVAEVAVRLSEPTSRMIRTQFTMEGIDMKPNLEIFFELAANGSLSLAGRIFRYDVQWTKGKCLVDEYEQYFCVCVPGMLK